MNGLMINKVLKKIFKKIIPKYTILDKNYIKEKKVLTLNQELFFFIDMIHGIEVHPLILELQELFKIWLLN